MKSKLILIFTFIISLLFNNQLFAKKIEIIYFNSDSPKTHWWKTSSDIMQEASRQLGIKGHVIYVNRNPFKMVTTFKKIASSSNKPDAVIFQNLRKNAVMMLRIAEKYKIKAFIFNAGLVTSQKEKYGSPREHFNQWIGEILPNDRQAGYNVAKILFKNAVKKKLTSYNKVNFVAINGTHTDVAAIERLKGLMQAIAEEPKINLLRITNVDWSREPSKKAINSLYKLYPNINAIWCANDPIALGVLDEIKNYNKVKAGKTVVIGSMDWNPEILTSIKNKKVEVSINGHFMETAWATIMIYDYFNGKDFASEKITFNSQMGILNKKNINLYLKYFKPKYYKKINFLKFSKVKNKKLTKYNFNFKSILRDVSK